MVKRKQQRVGFILEWVAVRYGWPSKNRGSFYSQNAWWKFHGKTLWTNGWFGGIIILGNTQTVDWKNILHQLIWQKTSHYLQGFIHVRWLAGCLPSTVCLARTCWKKSPWPTPWRFVMKTVRGIEQWAAAWSCPNCCLFFKCSCQTQEKHKEKSKRTLSWHPRSCFSWIWLLPRWWFSKIIYFHPCLGKISNLTNIYLMGWNHQPALIWNI